jgi:hypothetical protein
LKFMTLLKHSKAEPMRGLYDAIVKTD